MLLFLLQLVSMTQLPNSNGAAFHKGPHLSPLTKTPPDFAEVQLNNLNESFCFFFPTEICKDVSVESLLPDCGRKKYD